MNNIIHIFYLKYGRLDKLIKYNLNIYYNINKMKILFINHDIHECGIYQYGKRLASILLNNKDIIYEYKEINSSNEYNVLCFNEYNAIIYNYHVATLPWLNNNNIQKIIPNICIYHESDCTVTFDFKMDINATSVMNSIYRPLFNQIKNGKVSEIPIIGSFGFGFNNKGFDKIIKYVNEQYDEAIIKLNITYPHFTDHNNKMTEICNSVPTKPGVKVIITHDFMTDIELLNWLNNNTVNIFLYDTMHGRGVSSVIDYALSVNTPIGISDSYMFRHIYSDEICVYKTPIKDIIKNGLVHIEKYKKEWSHYHLLNKFNNYIIASLNTYNNNKMKNNTVLTDEYRNLLQPSIDELFTLLPDMMSRKIARANVQQAFAFNYIKNNFDTSKSMLCAGSHEDTCCHGLKKLNYDIVEIDPVHNYDLHTYCKINNYKQFDVVFSVSVIEHVSNDDEFIEDICKSLKSGGTCVLTCDFKDSYKRGDSIPSEDCRLYTVHDLLVRFKNILDQNDCFILGDIDYSAPPDFLYASVYYSFATFVFCKR
jgi:SAM-dependent methyltransferase